MNKTRINFAMSNEAIKESFDIDALMDFSKLCVDTARNQVEGVSTKQASNKIREKIFEVIGLSNDASTREIRYAMRSTAKREAVFEIISLTVEDTVQTGWQGDPFFNRFVEQRSMAMGQTNSFYIPDKIDLVISQVSGSNHDITRQRLGAGKELTVATHYYGAKVYMEAERYLANVEDWTALIAHISKAYTLVINTITHNAILGAGASLPSPTQWTKTGALTESSYKTFVSLLNDVAIATGSTPIIMGTKVALSGLKNMGNVSWISDAAKTDVYRTGLLANFEGTEMAVIPQAFAPNDTSKYLIDDTKIMIMPGNIDKFIKMYYEGDTQIKEVNDRNTNADNTMEYELLMKFGVAVLTNVRFGTWNITA